MIISKISASKKRIMPNLNETKENVINEYTSRYPNWTNI